MANFSLSRSTVIHAPTSVVHALVNDFHAWGAWSPWEKLDPALQRTYTGPAAGVGAAYAWSGNKKVGTGTMQIVTSAPTRIDIDLEFIAPFAAKNLAVFELTETGADTMLTWTMRGSRNLFMTIAGKLFFDKAIGKDFDNGLADIKRLAESA